MRKLVPQRFPAVGSRTHPLRTRYRHIAVVLAGAVLLAGCDPTRRVPSNSYLLKRNKVQVQDRAVDAAELEPIVKQQPNKRIVWVPFYLFAYNLPNPERMPVWQEKKNARIDRKNEGRAETGKSPKPYKRTRAEWLRTTVGEAPVLLDSNLTEKTEEQMRLYLAKEGWFRAQVQDTVVLHDKHWYGGHTHRPKAVVTYRVLPGPMYRLRNIRYEVDDPKIQQLVAQRWDRSLLKTGERFDDDVLEAERMRITALLRDDGFLYFNKDLIQYSADTTVEGHQVDLVMRFERPVARTKRGLRDTPEGTVYTIENVTISTYRQARGGSLVRIDTTDTLGYRFLYRDRLEYRPKALLHPIFLRPEERFQQGNSDKTYRRLTGLNVFDRVEISYDTTGTRGRGMANARISLLPGKERSMSLEGFGTNRGGALGTSVSLGFKHRNLFGTLGSLLAQVSVGLEAQQRITGGNSSNDTETSTGVGTGSVFNTVSIGPEVTLGFPRPFSGLWEKLFGKELFSKSSGSKLLINTLYNYQRRPDYTRSLAKISLGVQWQESKATTVGFYPVELNTIRIPQRSAAFQEYIELANDPVLRDSYTDHMIFSSRLGVTYSTPEGETKVNSFFGRANLESAGSLLRAIHELAEKPVVTDSVGNSFFTLGNVRYAEFVKLDIDARWRRQLHERSSVAFRAAAGAGLPFGNLGVLPFETSFFVGGANGLRAWRARSIGPGSYSAPLVAFDRIGEIRLEGNAEYRFKLIGFLEGAFFLDVGNIWNFKEDARKPGAAISGDLLSELAVGTGMGARLNFDFFIVRFDLGLQTKDPSLPAGERWLFQPKDAYEERLADLGIPGPYKPQLNFNLGIGYPF